MELESEIQKKVRLNLAKYGFKLFRNNVGAWMQPNGRPIRYGLCKGSSDIIGFKKIKIQPDMVGKDIAIFCAIETKRPKKSVTTDKQMNFIKVVENSGGFACIIKSENDIESILKNNEFVQY